jgi:hypothetical protein
VKTLLSSPIFIALFLLGSVSSAPRLSTRNGGGAIILAR